MPQLFGPGVDGADTVSSSDAITSSRNATFFAVASTSVTSSYGRAIFRASPGNPAPAPTSTSRGERSARSEARPESDELGIRRSHRERDAARPLRVGDRGQIDRALRPAAVAIAGEAPRASSQATRPAGSPGRPDRSSRGGKGRYGVVPASRRERRSAAGSISRWPRRCRRRLAEPKSAPNAPESTRRWPDARTIPDTSAA